jgi:hypothetical protein
VTLPYIFVWRVTVVGGGGSASIQMGGISTAEATASACEESEGESAASSTRKTSADAAASADAGGSAAIAASAQSASAVLKALRITVAV